MERTNSYMFTVKDMSDPRIDELRAQIKSANALIAKTETKYNRHIQRLTMKIHARGPRNTPHAIACRRAMGGRWAHVSDEIIIRANNQDLPRAAAEYLDVYVHMAIRDSAAERAKIRAERKRRKEEKIKSLKQSIETSMQSLASQLRDLHFVETGEFLPSARFKASA